MDWPQDAEKIPVLPVEVLGLSVLRLMAGRGDQPISRERLLGVNGVIQSMGSDYGKPLVIRSINEAWDWLFVNGLTVNSDGVAWTVSFPQSIEGHRIVSRKGSEILALENPLDFIHSERLLALPLHTSIEAKARIQFAIGAYESAVFEAFKELEIRVRKAAEYPDSLIGDSLMRQAFSPDKGPLRDCQLINAEQRAMMELYAGAIGAFKNPLSRRAVDYNDPVIAAEQILFADLLHRLLDGLIALSKSGEENS